MCIVPCMITLLSKFATVKISSKILKAAKKTYQLFTFCCCVVCAHQLKISQKLGKPFRKINSRRIETFKMSASVGNMSKELNYKYLLIIKLQNKYYSR